MNLANSKPIFSHFPLVEMVSNLLINNPEFNWDSKDKLAELQTSRKNVKSYFKGPYKEGTTARKALLVLNWLCCQGSMTLKSLDVDKGSCKKFFKVLEKIFQPETNDMISHF